MGGYIMQLQNFSVNDGDGIRTTVFMAGCPLTCAWCANPEGQTMQNPMTRYMETADILKVLRRQAVFYRNSGGGVTFSGGEPTAQPEFLEELTGVLYDEGFSLAIETCGQFSFERIKPILERMDLIFMDLKQIDPRIHQTFTGCDNARILANMEKTYELKIPMVIRIPAVIGVNCDEASLQGAFRYIREHAPGAGVELLPYHRYGEDKYRQLGMTASPAAFHTPTEEQLLEWGRLAASYGLRVVSYR